MKYLQIIFVIFTFKLSLVFAQEKLYFDRISVDKGLSQVSIFDIHQDKQGFLWFGTLDGLNRYDGYEFKIYRHNQKDSNSVSNNTILSIIEDDSLNLWIGTYDGLNKLDKRKEIFIRYNVQNTNRKLLSNVIRSIIKVQNQLWIGTDDGISCLDLLTSKIIGTYKPVKEKTAVNFRVMAMDADKNGFLWVGTTEGLFRFSISSKKFFRIEYQIPNDIDFKDPYVIRAVYVSSNGNIWVGTNGSGFLKFDPSTLAYQHYHEKSKDVPAIINNTIRAFLEDQSGNMWIGTYGGLIYYNKAENKFYNYISNPTIRNSLSSNKIISLLIDNSGALWVGTYGGGINFLDKNKAKFEHYTIGTAFQPGLSSALVLSFLEHPAGTLWVGTDNGLNFIDRKTGNISVIYANPKSPTALNNNVIRSLFLNDDGNVWIGTENGGLNIYNPKTKIFTAFKANANDPNSLIHNGVLHIFKTSDGTYWISTYRGLSKFDEKNKKFYPYELPAISVGHISDPVVFKTFEDSKNRIWFATAYGLLQYNKEKDTIIRIAGAPRLSSNLVRDIVEDKYGNLWIATSEGFDNFDLQRDIVTQYHTSDGLPNELVYSLLYDGQLNIWLSTNFGLSKFNIQTKRFQNYNISDGTQSNEFNQGAAYIGLDSTYYFGGVNGFNAFKPKIFSSNQYLPKVILVDFQIFNESILPKNSKGERISPSLTNEISLSYLDRVFSFKFAALNFTSSEKNQYAYQLVGFDKDYNYVGNRRFATYTNIPPGEYIFRVKASNNDGYWNETPTEIKIIIKPPFWQASWFYLLLAIALISLIVFYLRYKEKKHEKETKTLEMHVQMRTSEIMQQKEQIENQRAELEYINQTLELLVEDEIRKNREKDLILIQQSRQAVMGEMIGNIAHQWRQPLNALGVIIQNFQDAYDFGEIDEKYINSKVAKSMEIIQYMSQTIDDFRYFFRSDKSVEEFNIVDVVNRAISFIDANLKNNSIYIQVDVKDAWVQGYPNEYAQVLLNILNNAKDILIERKIEKPFIHIQLIQIENQKPTLTISDNGGGINPEIMDKIFDPYFTTKDSHKGTGLGLYMAKTIIEKNMNGKLTCENTNVGAKFSITI